MQPLMQLPPWPCSSGSYHAAFQQQGAGAQPYLLQIRNLAHQESCHILIHSPSRTPPLLHLCTLRKWGQHAKKAHPSIPQPVPTAVLA